MRFFLTGESGILGSDIARLLKQQGHEYIGFDSKSIDITDNVDVTSKMAAFKPDIVIHCAALTNVDLCEDERGLAYSVNVSASSNLSLAARDCGASIIYISSCGVYGNGKTEPYNESDATHPLTYHHETKLLGENAIRDTNANHLIIRTGWLFGGTLLHRKNFVEARRREAEKTSVMQSAGDKFGSPTYTVDVAAQLLKLVNENKTGTFNVVNEGCASRFEYVKEIVNLFNLPTLVEAVDSSSFPRKANMPDNECLENRNLNLQGMNIMRDWRDALSEYIKITYNK